MQTTLRKYAYSEDNNDLDVVACIQRLHHASNVLTHYTFGSKMQMLRNKKAFQYQPCVECFHSITFQLKITKKITRKGLREYSENWELSSVKSSITKT